MLKANELFLKDMQEEVSNISWPSSNVLLIKKYAYVLKFEKYIKFETSTNYR